MKARGIVVVVAVVLAGVAAGAVFMYVRGIQEETRAAEERVSVIVAKEDIPPGSELDPLLSGGVFARLEVPRTTLIRGVITTLDQLQGHETSSSILAGEQISTARLRGQAEFGGGVLGIPEGHKAVTLPLEAPRALGGVLQTGDHVSIYATFLEAGKANAKITVDEAGSVTSATGKVTAVPGLTITVVPDVQVLRAAVPTTSGLGSSSEDSKTIQVTMALTPRDAQRVIFAMERAEVWLGLLPPNEAGAAEAAVSFLEVAE
jgi:pilus assembly protein CpaB